MILFDLKLHIGKSYFPMELEFLERRTMANLIFVTSCCAVSNFRMVCNGCQYDTLGY